MENIEQIFHNLDEKVQRHSDELSSQNAVIKFNITGPGGGIWIASLKPGSTGIEKKDAESDCTITTSDSDFVKLVNGDLKPEKAILTGKVKLSGNVGIAMKLAGLFKS